MKSIFKRLNLIGLILMFSITLVACSNSNDKDDLDVSKEIEVETETNVNEISIFIPGYEDEKIKPLYDASIEDFRLENTDVKVKIVPSGLDYANTSLVSLIQQGKTPDIIITNSRYLRQLAELGAVAKLDTFMTEEFKEKRIEDVFKIANINGAQYGVPFSLSSKALYYRSDLIETPPTNWDELLETAKKVKSENPDMYGFSITTDIAEGTSGIYNFIYQNGGSATDLEGNIKLNTKENIDTLNYLKEFQKAGVISDPIGTSRASQDEMFKNGNLAMFISGPWEENKLNETIEKVPYEVALLPKGKNMGVTLVTDSFSISQTSKNKELAWELIEFMGQFKYQNAYDKTMNLFPVLKEEQSQIRYSEGFLKPFGEMINYGIGEPKMPVWDTFNKEFLEAVQEVLTDKASAEDALESAEKVLTKQN